MTLREKLYVFKKSVRENKFTKLMFSPYFAAKKLSRSAGILAKRAAGRILLFCLKKLKQENEIYLIISGAIGDNVYSLAYIEALHNKYPDKRITVFASLRNEVFLRTYPHIDKLRLSSIDYSHCMLALKAAQARKYLADGIIIPVPFIYEYPPQSEKQGALFNIRKYAFDLPENSPLTYHSLKAEPVTAIKDFETLKDKIVVVNPYFKFDKYYKTEIYKPLCEILLERGYIVYTNVLPHQTAISGTKPLTCSLEQLYSIACQIPCVVSRRSGILDFLIPSGVNMFVVYEYGKYSDADNFYKFFPLSEWHSKARIDEVKCYCAEKDSVTSLPGKFSRFLDEIR